MYKTGMCVGPRSRGYMRVLGLMNARQMHLYRGDLELGGLMEADRTREGKCLGCLFI
jgi:hypothetical protein